MKSMSGPSVTAVLAPWADFSGVNSAVLQAAADRGTAVHRACGAIAAGLWAPDVPEDCQGYVKSFERWFHGAVDAVIAVEPELVHPIHGYVGHPDLIARIKGDTGNTLIDYKTPVAQSKTWRPQLAGYWDLCAANDLGVSRVLALRLRKSGSAPVANEYTGTLSGDFSIFLSCLYAWRYFKGADV